MDSRDLPSHDDIEKLAKYWISELESAKLIPEKVMEISSLWQTPLQMYNKRRSGDLEVIK